jgi:hypothetical protein
LDQNLSSLNTPEIKPEDLVPTEVASGVEQSTAALDEMGAGLDSVATEADKGGAAATRFGKAVGFAVKAAGFLSIALTIIGSATQLYKDMQINLEEAGGGLDSFRESIYKDTAAWKENGEAIGTVQSKVTTSKTGIAEWAASMENTTGSSAKMTSAITETTDSITEQTLALGENSMEWLAQAAMADDQIQNMFKNYFNAGKDLDKLAKQANVSIQDMVGMALKDPGKGAANYLREWFTASADLQAVAPNLYGDLQNIAMALDGTTKSGVENSKIMKALGGAFGGAEDGAGDLNNELDNTIARVYTLTDYVGDLSSILSAAFTIRYGKEEATDALAASWENVKNRIDDAREAIEKIKDEIKSMTADRNILEYQLNIALKYGDSMRADKLRAELEAKDKELADKSKELGTAQDGASTSLVGNTKAAADNRAVMRGLIQDYNKYLESLANTNLSQKELKKRSDQAKADMLSQGEALGFSAEEMAPYTKSFKDFRTIVDKLPKELTLRVDADPGTRAFMEWWVKQNNGGGSSKKDKGSKNSGGPSGQPNKPNEEAEMWNGASTTPAIKGYAKASGKGDLVAAAYRDILDTAFNPAQWFDQLQMSILADFDPSGLSKTRYEEKYAKHTVQARKDIESEKPKATEPASTYRSKVDEWYETLYSVDLTYAQRLKKVKSMFSAGELKKMTAEHAKNNPGVYNPFNGQINPGTRAAGVKLDDRTGARTILKAQQENYNSNQLSNARTAMRADDRKAENSMLAGEIDRSYASVKNFSGDQVESMIKRNGAIHAKRYPGEYNPFTRKQNPWPESKKDLDEKGLVPLKTRAELHAATHPGEYNPYTGTVNTMPLDKGMADAMKDKKTRMALGAEHARLYPGEFNPYLNKVNDFFSTDSKKGAKELASGDIKKDGVVAKVNKILDEEETKINKRLKAENEARDVALGATLSDKKVPGNAAKNPIYANIVNAKDLKANWTGGLVGYASGGVIPGKAPQNPRQDNMLASGPGGLMTVRSGEFIQSQPAVQYYGLDFMNAINNLQIPRYASGGMIGTVSGGGSSVVELSPSAVMQIIAIANRPVNLYSDDRQIASSANRGNMLLAMRGSN